MELKRINERNWKGIIIKSGWLRGTKANKVIWIIGSFDEYLTALKSLRNIFYINFSEIWFGNWELLDSIRNVFENMKESRKKLKQAIKLCKQNQQQMKREKFINLYSLSDNKSLFWREIKK